ncbi:MULTISPECIES: GTPase domain-containing protein [Pseudofrankia]|uniref:GTPase domain-containing protein n=1 Tax=Pseudofrankia TaxID=2994363 RepID=UPI000234C8B0|nr:MULTISPECIES: GTPase domain-containing protein [Pseudofrankia]OHV34387.1 hypothetical protein BCD49_23920 [Pseudofrankia sp. EUN1h]
MTTDTAGQWLAELQHRVGQILGQAQVDDLAAEWSAFDRYPEVHVTVYGPYSAGKSSLLKRLLTDDGTPVPDWVTVGAGRSTFAVGAVTSGQLRFLDTPGIASGQEAHDARADRALLLTDAVMVVLAPSLITSDRGQVLRALGADLGAAAPVFPPGSRLMVVAKADTAADPADEERYRAFGRSKAAELRKLIGTAMAADEYAVYVVAADPFEEVGEEPDPEPSDYDDGRQWDGIAGLRTDLAALVSQRDELRAAARTRFWLTHAIQARRLAAAERVSLAENLEEADRQRARGDRWERELLDLDRTAREVLAATVVERARDAERQVGSAEGAELPAELRRRVEAAVQTWMDRHTAGLDQLSREISVELAAQADRPAAADLRQLLRDLLRGLPGDQPGGKPKAPASGVGVVLRENGFGLVKNIVEIKVGMPLAQIRDELTRYESFRNRRRVVTSPFTTPAQVEKAKMLVRRLDLIESAIPVANTLTTVVTDQVRGWWDDRKDESRAKARRKALDRISTEITERLLTAPLDEGGTGWNEAVETLRSAIAAARPPAVAVRAMTLRLAELDAAGPIMDRLVLRPPSRW